MTATVPSLGTALCVPNAPPTLPSLEAGSTHDSDSGDSEWQVDLCKQVTCLALVTKEAGIARAF